MQQASKSNQGKYSYVRKLSRMRKEKLISEDEFKNRIRVYMAHWLCKEYAGILQQVLGSGKVKSLSHVK